MKISEIFYSVQGEIDVGMPSIFIRLSGCNLIQSHKACKWCDSLFAEKGKDLTVPIILDIVKSYNCKNVVITGGEPLTQIKDLKKLFWKLNEMRYDICIETNGTIYNDTLKYFNKISCSPKRQNYSLPILKQINNLNQSRFKFVYEKGKNLWFEDIIKNLNIDKKKVWIMPEGRTKKEQDKKMIEVIEYCKKKGYNFTPRLQVIVWGQRRKV